MTLILLLAVCSGCVKRMSATNEPLQSTASGHATVQSVKVSPDGSQVELQSDRPLTYTTYKAGEPPRIIVDISQTEPGSVPAALEVNRGSIRRIDLVREVVGGGVLTRMRIALASDVDFEAGTDPRDKAKLVISVAKPQAAPEAQAESAPRAQQTQPEPKDEAKAETPLSEVKVEEKSLAPEPPAGDAKENASAARVNAVQAAPSAPAAEGAAAGQLQQAAAKPAEAVAAAAPATPAKKAQAAAAPAVSGSEHALTSVAAAADGVDLAVAGGVQTYNVFKLAKPDRIVVDLFGVKNKVGSSVVPIEALGVGSARIGSTADKVRVVLDAAGQSLPPFEVRSVDSVLKIRLKAAAPAQAAAPRAAAPAAPAAEQAPAAPPAPVAAPAPAPATAPVAAPVVTKPEVPAVAVRKGKGAIEAIDFKVVETASRILVKTAGDCRPDKPVRSAGGISLTLKNCQVPKQLQRAIDTSGFGTSVLSVTPYQVKVKNALQAKLQVRLADDAPFTMFEEGDTLVLEVTNRKPAVAAKMPPAPPREKRAAAPVTEELAAPAADDQVTEIPRSGAPAKKVYKGRRVTLEFSDADIRKIFQLIAEVSNLNFLVADDVSGTISIKLVNVPWDQALDVILDNKGLGMQRDGNIVQIKPKARIQTQADEDLAAKKASERVMELRTAIFEVNYASVTDVAAQFNTLKSERGIISKDDRTSKVIVKDIQTAIDDMRQLLKTLDTPERQVMIEARIVEASSNFTRDLGVQWDVHYKDASAAVAGVNSLDTGFGGIVSSVLPTLTTGGISTAMSFGKLTSNVQIDMRLSAAATIGQVKIISSPKVVTLNNKAAKISQGQSIPYQTTSAEGTKTEFVEAALTLEVTPHITPDGAVSMKIKASNNSPGTGSAGAAPPINKKEATTELVVANGETTVIGGIFVDSDTESNTGVPFLSDIPLLGWLFKSNSKSKNKSELLIFITPRLLI